MKGILNRKDAKTAKKFSMFFLFASFASSRFKVLFRAETQRTRRRRREDITVLAELLRGSSAISASLR